MVLPMGVLCGFPSVSTVSVTGFVHHACVRSRDLVAVAALLHLGRLEGDGRVLRDVEELRALEVLVARVLVGVDAARVDSAVMLLLLGCSFQSSVEVNLSSSTAHGRDLHVLDGETGGRVGGSAAAERRAQRTAGCDQGSEGEFVMGSLLQRGKSGNLPEADGGLGVSTRGVHRLEFPLRQRAARILRCPESGSRCVPSANAVLARPLRAMDITSRARISRGDAAGPFAVNACRATWPWNSTSSSKVHFSVSSHAAGARPCHRAARPRPPAAPSSAAAAPRPPRAAPSTRLTRTSGTAWSGDRPSLQRRLGFVASLWWTPVFSQSRNGCCCASL